MQSQESIFQKAKSQVTIPEAWIQLKLPGVPKPSCSSPFREDRKPSFSIFNGGRRFQDFATNEYGDVIDFTVRATGLGKLEAAQYLLGLKGLPPLPKWVDKPKPKKKKCIVAPEAYDLGTKAELELLAQLRRLPIINGLKLLRDRGILTFGYVRNTRCWSVRDNALRCIQSRPLEPHKVNWAQKANTHTGSDASWPVGLEDARNREAIMICEGGPDMLAVATAAVLERTPDLLDKIGFVCMTGATQKIAEDALESFKDKHCRVFAHHDAIGLRGADSWSVQLLPYASDLSTWISEKEYEDFNDWASRYWSQNRVLPHPVTI